MKFYYNITGYLTQFWRTRPMCIICLLILAVVRIVLLVSDNASDRNILCQLKEPYVIIEGRVCDSFVSDGYYGRISVVDLKDTYLMDASGTTVEHLTGRNRLIRVFFSSEISVYMGQTVRLRGKWESFGHATNPGEFDRLKYYHNRGYLLMVKDADIIAKSRKYSHIRQMIADVGGRGERVLDKALGADDSAVLKAMLFGDKSELPDELNKLYQRNGIAHILAISGLHISFLATLFYELLKRMGIPLRIRAAVSEATIVSYGMMVGFSPSSFRAICMFSMYLISRIILCSYDMLTALCAALTLTVLYRPTLILDSGLGMSFAAVFGVGFFYESFNRNIMRVKSLLSPFFVSLFVFLSTLPIILSSYYDVAFYSVLLNLIVIPLMSVLLVCALALIALYGLASCICPALTDILTLLPATAVHLILSLYKQLCTVLLNKMSFGCTNMGAPSTPLILLFYLMLLTAVLYRGRYNKVISFALMIASVCVISLKCYTGLDIYMLDIGQGDCMVIRYGNSIFADGSVYIVDCGSSSHKNVGEKRLIPFLKYYGIDRVDGVFITHPDADHINGIKELIAKAEDENISLGDLYIYEGFETSDALKDIADLKSIKVHEGVSIRDGELSFDILYPYKGCSVDNANDASLVMDIGYGAFHMLTTGDVEEGGERYVTDIYPEPEYDYTVIKVPHHGSSSSSTKALLEWADASIAVISCGKDNSYGHPHEEVLERYRASGTDIYRTDISGAVLIHTDGYKVSVDTFVDVKGFDYD